jgi:lactonase
MLSSLDGKIDGASLKGLTPAGEYEVTGAQLNGHAWICGRTTMQQHFADPEPFVPTSILAVKPDGTGMQTVVSLARGYMPNDLGFDAQGGLYFSDFRGISTNPLGGVYYVSADFKTITPVLPHLAMANGIALSPSGSELWATEFSRNLLHRIELTGPTQIAPFGTAIAYNFTGPAPDSMRADSDGNLYMAMYGQARMLVFNKNGIPIGQILLPGRDEGHNLQSTNMAIKPGTNDLYIVTNDEKGGQGATIFHAKVFAKALPLYSHQ